MVTIPLAHATNLHVSVPRWNGTGTGSLKRSPAWITIFWQDHVHVSAASVVVASLTGLPSTPGSSDCREGEEGMDLARDCSSSQVVLSTFVCSMM